MEEEKKYEEEIDLRDYINVILKRKWGILAIFLVAVIITTVISFLMPKTYQSSALLEIGKIRGNYIETPQDQISFLGQPATLQTLSKKLDMPEQQLPLLKKSIKTNVSGKFLEISAQANQSLKAKSIVDATTDLLIERHQSILEKEKNISQQEIQKIKDNIQETENLIIETTKETDRLKYPKTVAEGLLAQSYVTTLNEVKDNLEKLKSDLLNKERELNYGFSESHIVAPAIEPIKPVAPNKKQNVAIAGILGLFIGILWAFAAEFFSKEKNKLH